MKMVPAVPLKNGVKECSSAERKVFDRLKASFPDDIKNEFTCYHSLNLTRHAYKRFGEIDFLVCCPLGIYALEVKGGGVSCSDGFWHFTNRYDVVNSKAEGPFQQAETALHGLIVRLQESLPDSTVKQFVHGFGVITPDCDISQTGAEWDARTYAGSRDSKDLDYWLKGLARYWREKDHRKSNSIASTEALKSIKDIIRPDVEAAIPLHVLIDSAHESIAALTEDQLKFVDVVEVNPRVLCSGGAGTGKTFLAMELARRWTAEGMNIALVCKSPWLKSFLQNQFAMPNLTVATIEGLAVARKRLGLKSFDAIIVDEGQDLLEMDSIDSLDNNLLGGLAEGRWCFFYDLNNQAGLFGDVDEDALEYLKTMNPAPVPLKTNCRNTKLILDKVKRSLGADMGVKGAGQGPKVNEEVCDSKDQAVNRLEEEISDVINAGKLPSGSLTILSPYDFEDSMVSEVSASLLSRIDILDEYSFRNFPSRNISFSTIANFKGLENEAVILVDLERPERSKSNLVNHYVGMSRARSFLSLIWMK